MRKCFTIFLLAFMTIVAQADADALHDDLSKMWQQYTHVRTLHCIISMSYSGGRGPLHRRDGTYEYWADGEKYRILQKTNPPLAWADWDIRWDGNTLQILNIADSSLNLSQNGKHRLPMIATNPLLYPFQFLFPNSGPDLGIRMTWQDACAEATLKRIREAKEIPSTTPGVIEAEFPGDKISRFGEDREEGYDYHIEFGGTTPTFMPNSIKAVSKSGSVVSVVDIQYQTVKSSGGSIVLPQSVKYCLYARDNTPGVTINAVVKLIELDKPIAREMFTVDPSEVQSIRDDDVAATRPSEGAFQRVHPAIGASTQP